MARFELSRLDSYDNASLLEELQRVASLVKSPNLTQSEFGRHSRASASVICKRFGNWEQALALAGLAARFSGTPDAKNNLNQSARTFSNDELLTELRAVAQKLGAEGVTVEQFNRHGRMNAETLRRRFGSWWSAHGRAGLTISNLGKRYSETDYFENLLKVWTHYGRQPKYGEMDRTPSWIRAGAYEAKWGTWRNALKAFLECVTADVAVPTQPETPPPSTFSASPVAGSKSRSNTRSVKNIRRRDITLGLRYDVLRRDRFRCVICGASPSSRVGCELHVDHILAVIKGGKTVIENLRTLCSECNVGKGAKAEHESQAV